MLSYGFLLSVYLTLLHNKGYIFHVLNVLQRITIHGNNVSKFSFADTAGLIADAKQIGRAYGGGFYGFHRRHAGLNHVTKFEVVFAMGINARIGAESDFYACFV